MGRNKMEDPTCFVIKDEPFDAVDALIPPNHQIRRSSAPAELLCIPGRHSLGQLLPDTYNMSLLSPQSDDGYQMPSPCSSIEYIESVRSPIYPPTVGSGCVILERSTSMQTLPQCPSSPMQSSSSVPGSLYVNQHQHHQHQHQQMQDDLMVNDPCSPAPGMQRCSSQTKLNHDYIGAKINSMDIKNEPLDEFRPTFSNSGSRGKCKI